MAPLTPADVRADVAAQLYLEPEEVPEAENLFLEGLDSVRLLSLVARWRERGVSVAFADLAAAPTLTAWERLLFPTADA